MTEQILKQLAENLDSKISLKGMWEAIDGLVLERLLIEGHKALHRYNPGAATEFIHLAEAYLTADKSGMVKEAAQLLGELLAKIFFPDKEAA